MRCSLRALVGTFFLVAAGAGQTATVVDAQFTAPNTAPLALVKTVALSEIKGGMNHLGIDAKRQQFFVTAPGDQKVAVVDLKVGKVLRTLAGPSAAARFLPDADQLCVAGGQIVTFYDGASLRPVGTVTLQSSLDELQYNMKEKRLYVGVMDANKPGIAVIDAPRREVVATIKLPAKPQGFVLEANGVRIYANTPGAKQVTVLDRNARAIVAEWRLTEASNYPIALDEKNHRVFVGCRRPACVLVLDAASGRIIARSETGRDADDMSFDPAGKRIYLACGDGVITTVQQVDADHYQRLPDTRTVEGARNSLYEEDTKMFFLAVPPRGSASAELRGYQVRQ